MSRFSKEKKALRILPVLLLGLSGLVASHAREANNEQPPDGAEVIRASSRAALPQSPVAVNSRANMYYRGKGVPQDYRRAFLLYKQAAEMGHVTSQIMVGRMFEAGQGVKQDFSAAMQWYHKASDSGYANAQTAIGSLYRNGRGVSQDYTAAASWYAKAVALGDAEAECQLGYLTIRGWGVTQDLKKGQTLLESGVDKHNACAQHYLAFMYMNGMTGMLPDTAKALELDKLAAGNENPEAQYNMGRANEQGWVSYASAAEAVNWYTLSAENGYPLSMERLAEIYEKGQLKQKANPEQAQRWKKRAQEAWQSWPEPRPDLSKSRYKFMPVK